MKALLEFVNDPYERKARVVPGLLCALPLVVPVLLLLGPEHPFLSALLALLGGCGVMFMLARIARTQGKRVEAKLVRKWGGLPTTILLRHREPHFDSHTKRRYHADLERVTGVKMPTEDEERKSPVAADEAYRAACARLRELTRSPNFALLAKENANYGFQRNMQGVRWLGALICLGVLLFVATTTGAVTLDAPYVNASAIRSLAAAHVLSALVALVFLLAWTLLFTGSATRSAADAYAERLFEAAAQLGGDGVRPSATGGSKKKSPSEAHVAKAAVTSKAD